ncbi:DUF1800 domain-containing protein [Piscinibacter sakaiensis]|uniref:DUF1800 domain-containing protein n=1 Tax=Piscinibacter sakaiensis TaxID=1547922 RepID=UPI003AAC4DAC
MALATTARGDEPGPQAAEPSPPTGSATGVMLRASAAATALSALQACGGGGDGAPAPAPAPAPPAPPPGPAASPSRVQAARFLSQASLASTAAEIERVRSLGYAGWLAEQFAMPRSSSHVDWLRSKGFDAADFRNTQAGSNNMLWRKLLASPDLLRQRIVLALSEIIVISIANLASTPFKSFSAAAFVDILEANAFGNYRTLLEQVSTSTAMGAFLSFRGNRKANPATGSVPDENYAREVMQLFTIGLVELNSDGSPRLVNGAVKESYGQDDVSQMARVFTGWDLDASRGVDTPDLVIRPMVQIASRHETGAKNVLGQQIAAGTDGVNSLKQALDILIAHPNTGPFIGRQLIQRLVTSNPSPAYIARVANVFDNNGSGVKGDLKAVISAILLDVEARGDAGIGDPTFGKLREPVLRFIQWARTFGLNSPDDSWNVGDLSDPASRLGQSPLRAPSVFNFFRPGYIPPGSAIGQLALTAPEFQITTESSVAGYVNFMQRTISSGINSLRADYGAWVELAADSAALLAELNVVLAAGALPAPTIATLKTALDSISAATSNGRTNRLHAAITLVMAAPEYIAQK